METKTSKCRSDERIPLPRTPGELPGAFVRAFNERNAELFEQLFEPDSLLVLRPGQTCAGERRRAIAGAILADRVPVTVTLRHAYLAGDIALLITDYVHEGTGKDGRPSRTAGTATDVARRGADGVWRYVIDNPSGTDRG
jgi:uncharacterized protein (TIGR02246 family)